MKIYNILQIWISILIVCENIVVIYCQNDGFDDFDEPKLSNEILDVSESAWIEEGDKNNLNTLKIIKPSIRIGVKTPHPDDPDLSWEYEIIQAKPYVNVQPSIQISDMSDEENNDDDAIEDDDDDDDDSIMRQKRQSNDFDFSNDYNNFVKKNFEFYNPDVYQPQIATRKQMQSEEEDDDYDEDDAKADKESDADYDRVKKLSEKQAEEDKKNTDFCQVIRKHKNKECVVCKNPKTGGESESCSYSKDSKPKEFTYKRNTNIDDKDDDADQDDDGRDGGETEDDTEYDDQSEKNKNKLHPTEFQPQQPSTIPQQPKSTYRSQPKLFIPAHYQEHHNYHPPQYGNNYNIIGQNPYGPSSHGHYNNNNYNNDRRYYPVYTTKNVHPDTNTRIIPDELPVYDEVEEDDDDDDSGDQAYHSSAPTETTETTSDHAKRIKEFKNRDWSNCEQKFVKNLTCYYCLDEEGDRIEECMLLDDGNKNHLNPIKNQQSVKSFLQNKNDNRNLKLKNKRKIKKELQKSESKKQFVMINLPNTSTTTLQDSYNKTNGNNRTVESLKPTEIAKRIIKRTVKNLYYQKMNIF